MPFVLPFRELQGNRYHINVQDGYWPISISLKHERRTFAFLFICFPPPSFLLSHSGLHVAASLSSTVIIWPGPQPWRQRSIVQETATVLADSEPWKVLSLGSVEYQLLVTMMIYLFYGLKRNWGPERLWLFLLLLSRFSCVWLCATP